MSNNKPIKAISKNIKMSPHKVRRILDQIRGRSCEETLMILKFLPYRAKDPIWKIVNSVIANAQNNYNLRKENLIIDKIYADEGPTSKRIKFRAKGNHNTILKRTCHITVELKEKN